MLCCCCYCSTYINVMKCIKLSMLMICNVSYNIVNMLKKHKIKN